eukprot:scaffold1387_cov260-Pinguiococcus_pyrenoidosus.AAC.21
MVSSCSSGIMGARRGDRVGDRGGASLGDAVALRAVKHDCAQNASMADAQTPVASNALGSTKPSAKPPKSTMGLRRNIQPMKSDMSMRPRTPGTAAKTAFLSLASPTHRAKQVNRERCALSPLISASVDHQAFRVTLSVST